MLLCMRTTLDLNDELYRQAKEAALRSGRALKDVIEDALRLAFRPAQPPATHPITLPESQARPGLCPGVDLDSSVSLLDAMEAPDATA